jgi:hypothetical protein
MLMNPTDPKKNPSAAALREPTFIIEHEGALYVTEGVLEYRLSDDSTPEQRRGVEGLRQLYDQTRRSGAASARASDPGQSLGESYPQPPPVPVNRNGVIAFMATKPPRPPGG